MTRFIAENYPQIIIIALPLTFLALETKSFLSQPNFKQIEKIKEWLLWDLETNQKVSVPVNKAG
jgi:hypothetical protein